MITKHTYLLRGLLAVFGLGLAASQIRAGEVTGNVMDATGRESLPGAHVTVVENGQTTAADNDGHFSLSNLAAGDYTLRVSYVGYTAVEQAVKVPATGEVAVKVTLASEVVKLDKFVVAGYKEGRARALQQKESATNIMDIVSADAIGNLPDRNVAEAVARLPGVNLSLNQGEGEYVSIRGAEPNLNQVLMDGATMAAPGGSRLGRAVPLDSLGSGQISSIEVVKSVTPDLDANSIGGTLKIISASGFDHTGQLVVGSVAGNRNGAVSKTDASGQVTYSNQFDGGKVGLAASASWDRRNYENEWLQFGWAAVTLPDGKATYLPNDFEIKPEWGYKTREGVNFNLQYRPDENTEFYFRPFISHTDNPEDRFEIIYSPTVSTASVTMTSDTAGTFIGKNRTERRAFEYDNTEDLFNISTGFKKVIGPFTIEPMITYSAARANNPYTTDREFRNANGATGPIQFDLGTGFVPVKWSDDPAIDVPANYPLRRTRDDYGIQDEQIRTAKTDVTWKLPSTNPDLQGYWKSGVKFLHRTREVNLVSRRLIPVGTWNLAQTGTQLPSIPVYDGEFQSGFLPSIPAIDSFIAANPSLVTHDVANEIANTIEDDYHIEEYIYSAYSMGSVTFKKLTLMGGLRWERTDATIRAVEAVTAGSALPYTLPASGTTSYSKLFPNLQGVYHFTDQLLLRAAFTETIGRPAYEDARPLATFTYSPILLPNNPAFPNTGSVVVGNPQLKPYFSKNYDLSLEYYAKKSGTVASVAAFRKDIANPIYSYSTTENDVVYSGVGLDTLSYSSELNGTSGKISGLEFSLYQPLTFLPAPFDGFGIEANVTTVSSSEVIPTRPGENIPFFRQPSMIRNLTLFYEKGRFSGRVAYSYAGSQIYTLGANLLNDRYEVPRGQYDAQVRYRISEHYSVTGSVRNLTRTPDQMSTGIKSLVQMSRLLDSDYKVSLDFNF